MQKHLVYSGLCLVLAGTSFPVLANDKPSSSYDAKRFSQVCQGKAQGDAVSFAHQGIIWNGSCEAQFVPNNKNQLTGSEAEIYSTCQGASGATTATINGKEVKGKCALTYSSPRPK